MLICGALLVCSGMVGQAASSGLAGAEAQQDSRRALRRTPVVEVYEAWKDAVVCLTGAVVEGENPSPAEFLWPSERQRTVLTLGSGFVVHPAGYILTNAHAVEKVIAPQVSFDVHSRRYTAEVIGMAAAHDLALVKIEAGRPLKAVRLAASGDLMIGETVVVIGNPQGLIRTCSAGVLSATDRTVRADAPGGAVFSRLLQSDAALSQGSSGGPWFNVAGEVIGVSTMLQPGPQRIGFAIPVATIRRQLPDLLDVHRRYGILTGLEVFDDRAARVRSVAAASPAAQAGIRPRDVLVRLGEWPIASEVDFHLALVGHRPGEQVAVRLLRDGRPREVVLKLAPRPRPDTAKLLWRLGLQAAPLSSNQAQALGLRGNYGVVITAVDTDFYKSLKQPPLPGDVLVRIGSIRPRDMHHVGLLLERASPHERIPLVLLRRKGNLATRIDLRVAPRP